MKISLSNISKAFDEKAVLQNLSFDFEDKKITVITGDSGIGKTTLLRIIAGLETDFIGQINPSKYSVSVAFQEPRLFPGATVLENLCVAGSSERAIILLNEMGLGDDVLNLYPNELSGGMARRVSLARALLFNADVYLLDEPFSGLDEENIINVANVIKACLKDKTGIIVSHSSVAIQLLANNILNLN